MIFLYSGYLEASPVNYLDPCCKPNLQSIEECYTEVPLLLSLFVKTTHKP